MTSWLLLEELELSQSEGSAEERRGHTMSVLSRFQENLLGQSNMRRNPARLTYKTTDNICTYISHLISKTTAHNITIQEAESTIKMGFLSDLLAFSDSLLRKNTKREIIESCYTKKISNLPKF